MERIMFLPKATTVVLCLSAFAIAGCGDRTVPTAAEPPAELPGPTPVRVLHPGETLRGTIKYGDSSCVFTSVDGGWSGLCNAFEITVPTNGILRTTVRWTGDAPLALFAKSSAGKQIDLACCDPQAMRIDEPVDSGSTYRLEVADIGEPAPNPSISPVSFTIETEVLPIQPDSFGSLHLIVFGDEGRSQYLSQARVEVLEGPSAGELAGFDQGSGVYVFESLHSGFVRLGVSAPGFVSLIERVPVGTNVPLELVLQRQEQLLNATGSLFGITRVYGNPNSAWTGVKVEILDGPLAGIFTFTDEFVGGYHLSGLPPGVVHVRASANWLVPQTLSVSVSGETHLDFYMQQP
jgi:hypothetical protein